MGSPHYAVVAYVRNPVGRFVEDIRRELFPEHAHLAAHITVLPPRESLTSEEEALEFLEQNCDGVEPFEVGLGEVATFIPTTPTVFLRIEHAAYRMRELHDRLNQNGLFCMEQWPYMPHMTIVKMNSTEQAEQALRFARERWKNFRGSTRVMIEELTFVREGENNRWVDVAPIRLGRALTLR